MDLSLLSFNSNNLMKNTMNDYSFKFQTTQKRVLGLVREIYTSMQHTQCAVSAKCAKVLKK